MDPAFLNDAWSGSVNHSVIHSVSNMKKKLTEVIKDFVLPFQCNVLFCWENFNGFLFSLNFLKNLNFCSNRSKTGRQGEWLGGGWLGVASTNQGLSACLAGFLVSARCSFSGLIRTNSWVLSIQLHKIELRIIWFFRMFLCILPVFYIVKGLCH